MFQPAAYTALPYRRDIQGIRALGALIIMIFHIWVGKVSGGVDIFIFISGYLMTGIHLGLLRTHGLRGPVHLFSGVLKRITPTAVLILSVAAVLTALITPLSEQPSILKEYAAALLHLENLHLIRTSTDYLESTFQASPVQHFWALSAQMQIYLVLVLATTPLFLYSIRKDSLLPVVVLYVALCLASFIHAAHGVAVDAERTYFDPLARLWEFFSGGLLYLLSPHLRIPRASRNVMGLAGLMLVFAGALFIPTGAPYPAYPALVPILAAALLVLAGNERDVLSSRVLSVRWIVLLGSCSFSIYLWHWPILILYKQYFHVEQVPLSAGLAIMLASILLSLCMYRFLEQPLALIPKSRLAVSYGITAAAILVGGLVVHGSDHHFMGKVAEARQLSLTDRSYHSIAPVENDDQPTVLDAGRFDPRVLQIAKSILPDLYASDCHRPSWQVSRAHVCSLHDEDNDRVVMAVGASHVAQWYPALEIVARERRFNLLSLTKSACPFGADRPGSKCAQWNESALDKVLEINPDFVVVKGTRTFRDKREEADPKLLAYVDRIRQQGIRVIAIRDNPRFNVEIPRCVASAKRNGQSLASCRIPREAVLMPDEQLARAVQDRFDHFVDMTDLFCSRLYCYGAHDGLLIYRDQGHFHVPYVKGVAHHLDERLGELAWE